MKISVLDGYAMNPGDLSWDSLLSLGELTIFDRTPPEKIIERAKDADILIVNKVVLSKEILAQLPALKCICEAATGYNNVDIDEAALRKIPVCNVVGYSTLSVAQHVFALIQTFTNGIAAHNKDVHKGGWAHAPDFCYQLFPIFELAGKTLGIYGFGKIGQKVAEIGLAYGMRIIAHHKHPERDAKKGVEFVDWNTLLSESDILSLHAPLTSKNEKIINKQTLRIMKKSAILINTGRGGLIDEWDLNLALQENWIAGAGLDVLSEEPPPKEHPLFNVKNCIITPHIAWATKEARSRLLEAICNNINSFLEGNPQNVVNF
ncbi:MAG: D-2-hydroxyacid dehydrogenase [Bacteroidetes bacterium]|nr:D-2-hydroxyacid dehydrogenase [Bacteroidota bacterium]